MQANQPCERESIDSPTTPGLRIKLKRKSLKMTSKNMEQRAETSNVKFTPGTQNSSTTPCFGTFIGNCDTRIEYNMVSDEIRILDVEKVFVNRLKVLSPRKF